MRTPSSPPFLGRGWSFPPRVSPLTRATEMVEGEEDIAQSLFVLLSTSPGERIMAPTYGCDLQPFVFADLTTSLLSQIRDLVATAVVRWEPRIDLNGVSAELDAEDLSTVLIGVDYRVRATNTRNNLVFPFYVQEGTLVAGP